VVNDGGAPSSLQEVLVAVADLEHAAGRSVAGREKARPFPNKRGSRPTLDATTWVPLLDDGTSELLVAASLASLSSQDLAMPYPWMALALRGLAGDLASPGWPSSENRRDAHAAATWRAPAAAPLEVLHRRLRSSDQVAPGDERAAHLAAYSSGVWAPLRVVQELLDGRLDTGRALRLARAMSLLDEWDPPSIGALLRTHDDRSASEDGVRRPPVVVDPWFAAIRLCLLDRGFELNRVESDTTLVHPLPRRSWGRLVTAGRLSDVAGEALNILRRNGMTSLRRVAAPADLDPVVAAVALLLPLSGFDVEHLAGAVGDPERSTHPTDSDHVNKEHR
jgi:CRISPR-associated protein Csx17